MSTVRFLVALAVTAAAPTNLIWSLLAGLGAWTLFEHAVTFGQAVVQVLKQRSQA